ncbi:SPOR domain-containing protein [Brucepastera parasyntrophica]|uniref:SPOR domain-containing protein n=1 Tax=Brucepastera parasyntrophica TaxID=2880008 RepID=UPI002108829F|nr:SPOR domain-containing protein [Brucepastera parasyntrophica]ULQ59366.1 SPOR domain-containing protein [Brucepastera parasyntrophica]
MEQKKILWIVAAVTLFVMIIFGTAIILYSPSKNTGPSLNQARTFAPEITPGNVRNPLDHNPPENIDPDSWVREPEKTPGPDTPLTPPSGNINLTIVQSGTVIPGYSTLDVSGITRSPDQPPAPQTQPGTTASGQEIKPPSTQVASTGTAAPVPAKQPVKTEPEPKQPQTKPPAPPAKPVTVTEYWIQTGSFSNKLNAEKARDKLTARYLNAEIFTKEVNSSTTYRVRVGPYKTKAEADYWLGTVKDMPDFSGSYVSEVKTKQ